MIHHIENENILSEVLKSDKLIIVDFFAEWCGPCQMLTPILKKIDEKYDEQVEIFKVNVDESQDCAIRYGVNAMPTLIFFKNKEEIERQVGYLEEDELEEMIDEFLKD